MILRHFDEILIKFQPKIEKWPQIFIQELTNLKSKRKKTGGIEILLFQYHAGKERSIEKAKIQYPSVRLFVRDFRTAFPYEISVRDFRTARTEGYWILALPILISFSAWY